MKSKLNNFKILKPYLKGNKSKLVTIIVLSIFSITINVIYPLYSAQLIVKLTSNMIEQFILIAIVLFSLDFINSILNYFTNIAYMKVFHSINLELRKDVGREILNLSNKSLDEFGSGEFTQRLMSDTNTISNVFQQLLSHLRAFLTTIGVFVGILVINFYAFLFVIFSIILRFIIEIIRLRIKKKNNLEIKQVNDKISGFSTEMIRGARDIRMLNAEKSFLEEFDSKYHDIEKMYFKASKINTLLLTYRWALGSLCWFLFILLLAILVLHNQVEIALAVVLYNYGGRWNTFVSSVVGIMDVLTDFDVSAARVKELLENDVYDKEKFGKEHLEKVNGDFEFKDVSFAYKRKKVLNGLSFKVNANETVAFVGKSGAGKTTIFSLLCKMYDNYKGKITIDGVDIKKLDKDSIRGNITIVSQDPYIFNMSIKENLKLVCKDLTNKEMKEACKMACLDEFIENLPNKYDTIVGEGGVTLSGGQKQRLAIARAFVQKTEIILLDEATSALDNETQKGIAKAINNLQKDYTILIIAHRLSTIKNANRILFIDDGKVVAEGTHDKLLKNCKAYKELYEAEIEK